MTGKTDFEKKLTSLTNRNLSGEFEIELKDIVGAEAMRE